MGKRKGRALLESVEKETGEKDGGRVDALFDEVGTLETNQTRRLPIQVKPAKDDCVVYVGHIPHGFYEDEMKGFFSQFGKVRRVRVSRSKKTGRSRGFGFLEFDSPEVASIAADTMHGYLFFGQKLAVHVMESGKVHPELFKGAGRRFRVLNWRELERKRREKPKTKEGMERSASRQQKQRDRLRQRVLMLGLGIVKPDE